MLQDQPMTRGDSPLLLHAVWSAQHFPCDLDLLPGMRQPLLHGRIGNSREQECLPQLAQRIVDVGKVLHHEFRQLWVLHNAQILGQAEAYRRGRNAVSRCGGCRRL